MSYFVFFYRLFICTSVGEERVNLSASVYL